MKFSYGGFNIVRDAFGFRVKTIGRGSLPSMLSGMFNNWSILTNKIDEYNNSKKVKEK